MFGPKIKIEKNLYEKAKAQAETDGYSSVEELVTHLLEKEVAQQNEAEDEEALKKRLQGLGYIE
tara:strand:+ start:269 stop:460 length:192 start_codon:yes stop_codon:yes gene_type:complete